MIRFFRRIPLGRFFSVNLSKGGVSVSAGIPGAHVTTGTHGSRVTVGLPGTGLFYTTPLTFRVGDRGVTPAVVAWCAELTDCRTQPFDPARVAGVLNRQKDYGLADADLPPDLLATIKDVRRVLRDDFGYRLERTVPHAPTPAPTRPSETLKIVAVLLALAAASAFTIWWFAA